MLEDISGWGLTCYETVARFRRTMTNSAALTAAQTMPKAVKIRQAAELLGVSEWIVRKALRTGALHGRKLGSVWLIPLDAIDTFLAASD